MGYDPIQRPNGHYAVWKNIEPDIRKIINSELRDTETGDVIKQKGEFPAYPRVLREAGYTELLSAMQKYHGGFYRVMERMKGPDHGKGTGDDCGGVVS